MKILVITPRFPFPVVGASESDRAFGIRQFIRLGYEVKVITKISADRLVNVEPIKKELGIDIYPITYKFIRSRWPEAKKYLKILLTRPYFLDGAAQEYSDPELVSKFTEILKTWQPDYVWLDMTFMWPLIKYVDKSKTKIIIRSQAYEPQHFIEEEGWSLKHFWQYLGKLYSERQAAPGADIVVAITPEEEKIYQKLGAKKTATLALRGLPSLLKNKRVISQSFPLHVFFAGSTYGVKHNRKALEFLLKKIIPLVNNQAPGKFIFHIIGRKFPQAFQPYVTDNVAVANFVPDYEAAMVNMDIALIPNLAGRGMQQKIFEPLVRGIPVITSSRGLAGYPFEDGQHLLLAETAEEYVAQLLRMQDYQLREKLSIQAIALSQELFAQNKMDQIVTQAVKNID